MTCLLAPALSAGLFRIADLEQSGTQGGGKEARHEEMHGSVPLRGGRMRGAALRF